MGKKSREKRERKKKQIESSSQSHSWIEKDGIHTLTKGSTPTPDQMEEMTKEYQKQIRNSPMWDEMVKKFGEKEAEELLKQCRAELR